MNKIKVAINGFGRIGRLVLREALKRTDIEIVAINDLIDIKALAYLFTYDSVHGKFHGNVTHDDKHLIIDGSKIVALTEKEPSNLPWKELKIDVVIDCTGLYKTFEKAETHIKAGAQKVVLSYPSEDIPMYVMGVNHNDIKKGEKIVSNASCTTNCLAPVVKILNDNFGIVEGLMTTVHAATASQLVVDGSSKKDFRGGRSALNNIIPASTGAAKAVTKVIPALEGKLTGMAFRVPVPNVSVVDLTVKLAQSTTYDEIMAIFKKASENEMKGILGFTNDAVVSQDFVSDPHTSIIDSEAGIALNDTFYKIVSWYDNEYGYAAKLLDLTNLVHYAK